MKLSSLKPGMIVWDVGRQRMGNTTMSTVCVWQVKILTVEPDAVMANWNGNAYKRYTQREISRWRAKEPVLVDAGLWGRKRLATREELKRLSVRDTPR